MGLPMTPSTARALKAAGIDVSKLPGVAVPGPCLDPGVLVVEFEVQMRPVPWKAPLVLRTGISIKDKKLLAWQAEVGRCGKAAMLGLAPYAHPARLEMQFHLTPRAGSPPDVSNLVKAAEDACQGAVLVNDRKVVGVRGERFLRARRDMATIRLYAAEDQ